MILGTADQGPRGGPILKGRVNPSAPLRPDRRFALASPFGLKAWPKRHRLSRPLWPRLSGLSWPPFGLLQLAFSRPVLASLAAFGLTWPRLASQCGPWPRLACLKALPCPAAGVPTLRSHRPCRCFLRVALSRSKPENRADRGLRGALGLAFGTPWAPFGWP